MSKSPEDEASQFTVDFSPPRRSKPGPSVRAGPIEKKRGMSELDTEFHYYRTLLKLLIPCLSRKEDRDNVLPWIHRLSQPCKTKKQREKNNRYLMMLCLMALRDELEAVFLTVGGHAGPLPEIMIAQKHRPRVLPEPQWNTNLYWDSVLEQKKAAENPAPTEKAGKRPSAKSAKKPAAVKCGVHGARCPANVKLHAIGETLDRHFKLFVHMATPYAAILPRSSDRVRAAKWLKALCELEPKTSCGISKAIRNDYMMALIGYLRELQLLGPFEEDPPDPLSPIAETAYIAAELHPQSDPSSSQADKFLKDMVAPEQGAFAFMILTNDLYENPRK